MITLIVLGICYAVGEFPPRPAITTTLVADLILFCLAGNALAGHVNK